MLAIVQCPTCTVRVVPKAGRCPSCQGILPTSVPVEEPRSLPAPSAPSSTVSEPPLQQRTVAAPVAETTTPLQCVWLGKGRGLTPLPYFWASLMLLLSIASKLGWVLAGDLLYQDLLRLLVSVGALLLIVRAVIRNHGLRTVVTVHSRGKGTTGLWVRRASFDQSIRPPFRIDRIGSPPSVEGVILRLAFRRPDGEIVLLLQERRRDLSALPQGWIQGDIQADREMTYEAEDLMWISEQLFADTRA